MQGERLAVAVEGEPVVAGLAGDGAEAVQGPGLGLAETVLLVQGEGGFAGGPGLAELAEPGLGGARRAERVGLPHPVAEGLEQGPGAGGVGQRPPVVVPHGPGGAQEQVRVGLPVQVSALLGQGQGAAQVPDGLGVPARVRAGEPEEPERRGPGRRPAQALGGGQPGLPGLDPVAEMPAAPVEGVERQGQPPGLLVPLAGQGQPLAGQQACVLGGEPRHRLALGLGLGPKPGPSPRPGLRGRGVQVEAGHPAQRRGAGGRALILAGLFGGMQPDQVVHPVAARRVLPHQGGGLELAQDGPRLGGSQRAERGRGGQADIGAGRETQLPEHGRGRGPERPVGAGQHGPDARGQLAGIEGVQPGRGVPQFGGEDGEREIGMSGGPGRDHADRQGQAGAAGEQLGRRVRLGGQPRAAQAAGEQFPGLVRGQHVEVERAGAVPGDQAGQPAAAGDQHRAAGTAGQQGDHLAAVAGVVQHHQHPLPGHQAAVQPGLGLEAGRDRGRVDAERVEEPADRRRRGDGRPGRVEAAQVGPQLPVGEPVEVPAGPVQGQPGLTDAAAAAVGRDHHRSAGPGGPGRLAELGGETVKLGGPAGQEAGRCRQLAGRDDRRRQRRRGRRRDGQHRIGAQDPLVELPQRGTGVGAEFLGQPLPGALVVLERVGLPPAAVQGQHQLAGHPFIEGVLGRPGRELGQQRGVLAAAQPDVGEVEAARAPLQGEGRPQRVDPGGIEPGEGLSPPQAEGLGQRGGRPVVVAGRARRACPADQVAETVQVDRVRADDGLVPGGLPGDGDVAGDAGRPPQQRYVGLQRAGRVGGQPVAAPDALDQLAGRDHPVRVGQQRSEYVPPPGVADVDHPLAGADLDVTEEPEFHRHHDPWPARIKDPRRNQSSITGNPGTHGTQADRGRVDRSPPPAGRTAGPPGCR